MHVSLWSKHHLVAYYFKKLKSELLVTMASMTCTYRQIERQDYNNYVTFTYISSGCLFYCVFFSFFCCFKSFKTKCCVKYCVCNKFVSIYRLYLKRGWMIFFITCCLRMKLHSYTYEYVMGKILLMRKMKLKVYVYKVCETV